MIDGVGMSCRQVAGFPLISSARVRPVDGPWKADLQQGSDELVPGELRRSADDRDRSRVKKVFERVLAVAHRTPYRA
jgi:hypothetical protein